MGRNTGIKLEIATTNPEKEGWRMPSAEELRQYLENTDQELQGVMSREWRTCEDVARIQKMCRRRASALQELGLMTE